MEAIVVNWFRRFSGCINGRLDNTLKRNWVVATSFMKLMVE